MADDHEHPGLVAALLQLTRHVEELTTDVDKLIRDSAEQRRIDAERHAEHRADINRLYAAWPEHLRHGHQ